MKRTQLQPKPPRTVRCAIYTRKSTDEGLEQEFNSLDAQREAAEAFIKSQASEGWTCLPDRYDDGGFSGGSLDRPALARLAQVTQPRITQVLNLLHLAPDMQEELLFLPLVTHGRDPITEKHLRRLYAVSWQKQRGKWARLKVTHERVLRNSPNGHGHFRR